MFLAEPIDAIDQDQGVVDQDAGEADDAEHGQETQGLLVQREGGNDADESERDRQHHQQGLGQRVEQQEQEQIDAHGGGDEGRR